MPLTKTPRVAVIAGAYGLVVEVLDHDPAPGVNVLVNAGPWGGTIRASRHASIQDLERALMSLPPTRLGDFRLVVPFRGDVD
jgi:hypothetical protein